MTDRTPTGDLRERLERLLHVKNCHGNSTNPCGCVTLADAVLPVVEAETADLHGTLAAQIGLYKSAEEDVDKAEDRLRKAERAYGQLAERHADIEATRDRWRKRAEEAEVRARRAEAEVSVAEEQATTHVLRADEWRQRAEEAEAKVTALMDERGAEQIERIQAERDALSKDERVRLDAADAPMLRIQLAGMARQVAEAKAEVGRTSTAAAREIWHKMGLDVSLHWKERAEEAERQRQAVIDEVLTICDSFGIAPEGSPEHIYSLGRKDGLDWVRAAVERAMGKGERNSIPYVPKEEADEAERQRDAARVDRRELDVLRRDMGAVQAERDDYCDAAGTAQEDARRMRRDRDILATRLKEAERQRDEARAALREFVDGRQCDPHPGNGFCQTHGETPPCPHAAAKRLLALDQPEGT